LPVDDFQPQCAVLAPPHVDPQRVEQRRQRGDVRQLGNVVEDKRAVGQQGRGHYG
jgi:hypothetical protein